MYTQDRDDYNVPTCLLKKQEKKLYEIKIKNVLFFLQGARLKN